MLLAVEKDKAKILLDNYFSMLSVTGYVKRPVVKRFLMWLFLVDFVELVYLHLTDDDYNLINEALICLFSTGCCLLPYGAITEERKNVTIGESSYMGTFNIRVTEQNQWRKAEEDIQFRVNE